MSLFQISIFKLILIYALRPAAIVAFISAVVAAGKYIYESTQKRKDVRAKQFLALRSLFRGNGDFQNIIEHLYGDQNFSTVPMNVRIEFMAFFEDLAFLMNSALIRPQVAFYMFGGDAITAWSNDDFWDPKLRTNERWGLLNDFVGQMKLIDNNYKYQREAISL